MSHNTTQRPLEDQRGENLPRLVQIMQRLLADDGCPWDRKQTFETLRRYVIEEAYEVVDAIDRGNREDLKEELGDLLLQVVFQAELARKEGSFGPNDVVDAISEKLVRRHPHVFGEEHVEDADEVLRNWERIKSNEHKKRGILDSVPRSLPALSRAQRMGEKAQRVGFDWPETAGARDKVTEELQELEQAWKAGDQKRVEDEFGDLLFSLVNLARHMSVDAEQALRHTNDKFERRFQHVERRVEEAFGGFSSWQEKHPGQKLPLDALDQFWNEAKSRENS